MRASYLLLGAKPKAEILSASCEVANAEPGDPTPTITYLGSPVVPFYPFSFWVPLLKPNSRKKGTLIIKGLLGNLATINR